MGNMWVDLFTPYVERALWAAGGFVAATVLWWLL